MADTLINSQLLDEKFYLQSMSLFLKNSYGMEDRCKMYVNILNNIVDTSEELFKRLNIFYYDISSKKDYCDLNGIDKNSTSDRYLDLIAGIFNINREFEIRYTDPAKSVETIERVKLDNYELMLYIQAIATKFIFDGSYEQLHYFYNGTSLLNYDLYYEDSEARCILTNNTTKFLPITNLGIKYMTVSGAPLTCNIYYTGSPEIYNTHENIKKLFYGGYLTIESLGIVYNRLIGIELFKGKFYEKDNPANIRFYNPSIDKLGQFA